MPKPVKSSPVVNPLPKVDIQVQHEWSGPLPPPHDIERYNDIIDDGANRIMQMWEAESKHRRALEMRELEIYGKSELNGKIYAFSFLVLAMAVSSLAIYFNQPWVAAILGAGTIASVVWAFVTTNRDKS